MPLTPCSTAASPVAASASTAAAHQSQPARLRWGCSAARPAAAAEYCAANGLVVNTVNTKVVVYAARAPQSVPEFAYEGSTVERVPDFRYLGTSFHQSHAFCAAAAARAAAGTQATHVLRRRMADCGLHAHPLLAMQMFDVFVRPVMSYGSQVWGPQIATASLSGRATGACRRVQLASCAGCWGSDTCSALTVLAETGQLPLSVAWAGSIVRFADRVLGLEDTRVAKQALLDSVALAAASGAAGRGRQCWAAEVGGLCQLLGLPTAFLRGQLPDGLDADAAVEAASARHLGCYRGESAPAMVHTKPVTVGGWQQFEEGSIAPLAVTVQ